MYTILAIILGCFLAYTETFAGHNDPYQMYPIYKKKGQPTTVPSRGKMPQQTVAQHLASLQQQLNTANATLATATSANRAAIQAQIDSLKTQIQNVQNAINKQNVMMNQ